jgi:hypothetical protein
MQQIPRRPLSPILPSRKRIGRIILFWLLCILMFTVSGCLSEGGIPILVASSSSTAPVPEIIVSASAEPEPLTDNSATPEIAPSEMQEDAGPFEETEPTLTRTASPTPRPSATLTVTAGPSPTATRTATRTSTATRTRWPTITRTITPTPTPPAAVLRISRPGLLSKVSSPFRVEGVIKTGDDGKAWLRLFGEDGRLITEQMLDFGRQANMRFAVSPQVEFEISAVAETGRLMLISFDSFGRTVGISSIDLILMKAGVDEINPAIVYWEPYLVRSPRNEAVISGGAILVSGVIRPVNDTPVIFELIDTSGQVIASSQMVVDPPSGDLSHTPFQMGIPYRVNASTPVRLVLRQESDNRISGTIALWSMAITLEP